MSNRFILVAHPGDSSLDMFLEELSTTQYTVVRATDGQETIDYLETLSSDLAIVSLELPVVSGLDVIWALLRQRQAKPTKLIATCLVDAPLVTKVLKEFGVDAVIQTPIS